MILSESEWQEFIRQLEQPQKPNAKLIALMQSTPPWGAKVEETFGVELKPGWLAEDVERAERRVREWLERPITKAQNARAREKQNEAKER